MKVIVLFSGGMNSTTLLYDLRNQEEITDKEGYEAEKFQVTAVTIDYGQPRKEIIAAGRICESLKIPHIMLYSPDLKQYENAQAHLLSNLILRLNESVHPLIIYSGHNSRENPDGIPPAAMREIKQVIRVGNYPPVELFTPYLFYNKTDVLKLGLRLGVDYSLTWSCTGDGEEPCGTYELLPRAKCNSCIAREKAFEEAGIKDPLEK